MQVLKRAYIHIYTLTHTGIYTLSTQHTQIHRNTQIHTRRLIYARSHILTQATNKYTFSLMFALATHTLIVISNN